MLPRNFRHNSSKSRPRKRNSRVPMARRRCMQSACASHGSAHAVHNWVGSYVLHSLNYRKKTKRRTSMTTTNRSYVTGIFVDEQHAQQAMTDLQEAGFSNKQIQYSPHKRGASILDSLMDMG